MDFDVNKLYSRQEVAKQISEEIIAYKWKVIGVTGTSCVGKSTFTGMLIDELKDTVTFQVINVDCYLKEQYRAGTKFWKGPEPHLTPNHFDWGKLAQDVETLKSGKNVQKQMYVRGTGWNSEECLWANDVLILEGLFMDSIEAAAFMNYDLLVALSADDEMIKKKRMERDDYYRANFKDFSRTKEETLKEIEQTLKAGKSYVVCHDKWNCMRLEIQEDFQVKMQVD